MRRQQPRPRQPRSSSLPRRAAPSDPPSVPATDCWGDTPHARSHVPAVPDVRAVQEVFTGDRPRLSISGWFHAPAAPDGAAHASLAQLQMQPGQDAVRDHRLYEGGWPGLGGGARMMMSASWPSAACCLHPTRGNLSHIRVSNVLGVLEGGSLSLHPHGTSPSPKLRMCRRRQRHGRAPIRRRPLRAGGLGGAGLPGCRGLGENSVQI